MGVESPVAYEEGVAMMEWKPLSFDRSKTNGSGITSCLQRLVPKPGIPEKQPLMTFNGVWFQIRQISSGE
ncbi:UNVERIFIED_CONTAM: hypothetical protein FKN15_020818 [Acipenser sinensis]